MRELARTMAVDDVSVDRSTDQGFLFAKPCTPSQFEDRLKLRARPTENPRIVRLNGCSGDGHG